MYLDVVVLVYHIPCLELEIIQLTAHLGAPCIPVFVVNLGLFTICVLVHV